MATRRGVFMGCAVCAALGLAKGSAEAQPAAARRSVLQSSDIPGTNMVTHLVMVEFPANGGNPRHTHPGVTTGLVLEGELELVVDDAAPARLKAGESLQIPNAKPHVERAGAMGCKAIVSFTVEKGKPLASPA